MFLFLFCFKPRVRACRLGYTSHLSVNLKSFLSTAAGGCIKPNVLESLGRQNIAILRGFLPRHLSLWLVCEDKIRSLKQMNFSAPLASQRNEIELPTEDRKQ